MNTDEQNVIRVWQRLWLVLVLIGLIALAMGVFALVNPQATAALPVQLLGVLLVLDGLRRMATAVIHRQSNWGNRLFMGLAESIMGLLIFAAALEIVTFAFTFILYLTGFGLLISGGVNVWQAIQGQRPWTTIFTGLLLLGFGLLMFALTGPLAVSLVWVTGIFSIAVGTLLLVAGFRVWRQGGLVARQMWPIQGDGVVVDGEVIDGAYDVGEDDARMLPDGREDGER
ncbi:MAG TPA: DUF308 domain-containing protein [Chloroflexota bacterium]|nr:DUF308 domain-containing protein [Chloroflexota bacterium]